jgi:hypothetical protein
MTNPFNSGPIAPERNPPINPQYYQPSQFEISAISLVSTTIVTTTINNNYVIGQTVRLLIPATYGSIQLNEQQGQVIDIPSPNQVTINVNSTNVDAFVASPTYGPTKPQILAIGDVNSGQINASGRAVTGTFIPGSFIDISPA